MNWKLMTKLLLLAGLLVGFVPVAQAFYNPSTGRWLNRDPLGDEAFIKAHFERAPESRLQNLRRQALLPPYLFVSNDPVDGLDILGLWVARPDPPPPNITTIVCQGGKAVPRLAPGASDNSRCVILCILSHERVHAEEANAQNACAGKPNGVAVAASSYAERVNSEINAYKRQLKCLQAVKDSGTAVPPDKKGNYPKDCPCRLGNLEANFNKVTERLAGWEKANPDDPSTWPQDDL